MLCFNKSELIWPILVCNQDVYIFHSSMFWGYFSDVSESAIFLHIIINTHTHNINRNRKDEKPDTNRRNSAQTEEAGFF